MTWKEEHDRWREWARQGNDIDPVTARRIDKFYEAMAEHCGRGGMLSDEMPKELVRPE